MFGCDGRKQSQSCTTCWIAGAKRVSAPSDDIYRQCSRPPRLERVKKPNNAPHPLHTRTAISRLINCESRSLETLNHSFSILSRAASLAALTRSSTLFAQQWRRRIYSRWSGGGGWWGGGIQSVRLGAEM